MKQYTVTELAKLSGVSKATMSRWLDKKGVAPVETEGKKKLFNETILNSFAKEHENAGRVKPLTPLEILQDQVNERHPQAHIQSGNLKEDESASSTADSFSCSHPY